LLTLIENNQRKLKSSC